MAERNAPVGEQGTIAQIGSAPSALSGGRVGWQGFITDAEYVPELRWPQSNRWYERMLHADSQIEALHNGLMMPLTDYIWAINPNKADPGLVAMLAADLGLPVGLPDDADDEQFEILPGLYRFNFVEHLSEALLAVSYGHYYFEQDGVIESDGTWRLKSLAARPPATLLQIVVDPSGDLVGIRQNIVRHATPVGNSIVMATPPLIEAARLTPYIWRGDGRAKWLGRPMLRSMYRHWLIKDTLMRVDAINHERAGGVPGVETDQTFQGNTDQLRDLASNFRVGEDSGFALPPGAKMVLQRAGGTDVVGSIRYHDEAMSKVWQGMVMQLGQSETGSRALGSTFAGLQELAQRAVARWFAVSFREKMIRAWWDYNVPAVPTGQERPYPTLVFRPRKSTVVSLPVPEAPAPPAAIVPPGQDVNTGTTSPQAAPAAPVAAGGSDPPTGAAAARPSPLPSMGADDGPVLWTPDAATRRTGRSGVGDGGGGRREDPSAGSPGVAAAEASPLEPAPQPMLSRLRLPNRPTRRQPYPHELRAATDFAALDTQHEAAAIHAFHIFETEWLPLLKDDVRAKIEALGDNPSPAKLAALSLDAPDAASLEGVLLDVAKRAADEAGAELAAQSVSAGEAKDATIRALISGQAEAMAQQVADGVRLAATRRAVQLANPAVDVKAAALADQTVAYLGGLKHAWEAAQLRGATQQAQTAGRFARFQVAESALRYYVSALNDVNTCEPCVGDDGTEFVSIGEAMAFFPSGANPDCDGGPNCRCTVVAVDAEG